MFYKFDTNGFYVGTSETEVAYSTSIAPPDNNQTATWVWNHVSWVAMPNGWKPPQSSDEITLDEIVVEEIPPEVTPTE